MTGNFYTLKSLLPGNSVGYLIKRCEILATQTADRRFDSQSITFTQWTVLTQLSLHPHLTTTEFSHNLGQDMGRLTRVVDDLDGLKLVCGERSEHHRRAVRITATADGRRLAKTTMPLVLDFSN